MLQALKKVMLDLLENQPTCANELRDKKNFSSHQFNNHHAFAMTRSKVMQNNLFFFKTNSVLFFEIEIRFSDIDIVVSSKI